MKMYLLNSGWDYVGIRTTTHDVLNMNEPDNANRMVIQKKDKTNGIKRNKTGKER